MFWLVIISIIAFSITRKRVAEGVNISSMILITSLYQYLNIDHFLYNTILLVTYLIYFYYQKNILIKSATSILIIYSLIAFFFDTADIIFYTDFTWQLIISWADLYDYAYYITIALILAGLANDNQGGFRNNSSSNNLFFSDSNSASFKRVRSEFGQVNKNNTERVQKA